MEERKGGAQGFAIEANHLKTSQTAASSKHSSRKQLNNASPTMAKPASKKNVLGLDFEIPDELSALLAQEMSKNSDE